MQRVELDALDLNKMKVKCNVSYIKEYSKERDKVKRTPIAMHI